MTILHEKLTYSVIGAFYEVYNTLGFGFIESIYAAALERELRDRGHSVAREAAVRIYYKDQELGTQRLDMIVDRACRAKVHAAPLAGRNQATPELFARNEPRCGPAASLRTESLRIQVDCHTLQGPNRTAAGATDRNTNPGWRRITTGCRLLMDVSALSLVIRVNPCKPEP
jgi:hypothetical protein